MRRSLHRTFSRPERPTLTSRSLQSIMWPFQKRFREVFGNARILIFYLSIKALEEKCLPISHLGWSFLVSSEGKATKENISIFWFISPSTYWALGYGKIKTQSYITLKDHKPEFHAHPTCCLIKPSKSEIGIISKRILDEIHTTIIQKTQINQFAKVKSTRANHLYKLYCKLSRINCFKYSFFNNVISYWNNLPSNVVEAGTLELFKCKLKSFLKL